MARKSTDNSVKTSPPMPSTTENQLKQNESDLQYIFPREYRKFLQTKDGGMLNANTLLYSAGPGIHPDETLAAANTDREDVPLMFIGRFADEEFGFDKSDNDPLQRAVHVYMHETGKTKKLSDSFRSFIEQANSNASKPPIAEIAKKAAALVVGRLSQVRHTQKKALFDLDESSLDGVEIKDLYYSGKYNDIKQNNINPLKPKTKDLWDSPRMQELHKKYQHLRSGPKRPNQMPPNPYASTSDPSSNPLEVALQRALVFGLGSLALGGGLYGMNRLLNWGEGEEEERKAS